MVRRDVLWAQYRSCRGEEEAACNGERWAGASNTDSDHAAMRPGNQEGLEGGCKLRMRREVDR